MTAYKVVGRYKKADQQKPWCRGKEGTQAKKRTYIDKTTFDKHSPDLIKRWGTLYDVEVYNHIDGNWQLL